MHFRFIRGSSFEKKIDKLGEKSLKIIRKNGMNKRKHQIFGGREYCHEKGKGMQISTSKSGSGRRLYRGLHLRKEGKKNTT